LPDSPVAKAALTEEIRNAILSLTPREEQIIRMRFEIGYETACTLNEIGKNLGLTPERIRQLEKEALKKLAASEQREALKSFLE